MTLGEKGLAYARLLRLSNGPTAVADVWMGYAVVSGKLEPTLPIVLATVASLCFYHGGMALNDAVDAPDDAENQRGRPIEHGQVHRATAFLLVYVLLGAGAAIASLQLYGGVVFSILLIVAIVAYNSRYKRSPAGPLLMGVCRLLNVHLGIGAAVAAYVDFSLGPKRGWAPIASEIGFAVACCIGVYICGVTWFARNESRGEKRAWLVCATLVCLAPLAYLLLTPPYDSKPPRWDMVWVATALIATRGMVAAVLQPTPRNIGRGVGLAIQGLVVIDAVLAAFYAGPVAGLAILALLPVTMLLAQWIPQT